MVRNKNSGFTLIEVMIAMAIMGMISVLIASAMQSSIRNKKKTEATLRDESAVYDALNIIITDINKAFHYQDFYFDIEQRAIDAANLKLNPQGGGAPSPTQIPPKRVKPVVLTHFAGSRDSLHFASLNNFRSQFNSKECKQMEVGYYLDRCKSARTQKESQCLWRRTSKYMDDEITKGGDRIVLVENIDKFELSYIGPNENDEWKESWRSDNRGNADTQNKFPNLVKITISTTNKREKSVVPISLTAIAEVYFPNNTSFFQPVPGQPGQPGQPGFGGQNGNPPF